MQNFLKGLESDETVEVSLTIDKKNSKWIFYLYTALKNLLKILVHYQ